MINEKQCIAIIAAGGKGKRLGEEKPKQFLEIDGVPIICKSTEPFLNSQIIDQVYLVVPEGYEEYSKTCFFENIEKTKSDKIKEIIGGGKERQDSIYEALRLIRRSKEWNQEIILIHDGARPFVTENLIERVAQEAEQKGAVIPVLPIADTVRMKKENSIEVIDRDKLMIAQTPQGFEGSILIGAYEKSMKGQTIFTDDGQLVQNAGFKLYTIEGEVKNKKITFKEDWIEANRRKGNEKSNKGNTKENSQGSNKENNGGENLIDLAPRVGIGYDVHKLVGGRKLILGGERIPFEKGLDGHSDADVLTHAIMDSLLGATALGDIGKHFPPNDGKYKDISSLELLQKVKVLIEEYEISNIDATLICEKPKIKDYAPKIKKNICEILEIEESRLNIKGTTTEKLGFLGREEGIAAEAVCILIRRKGGK